VTWPGFFLPVFFELSSGAESSAQRTRLWLWRFLCGSPGVGSERLTSTGDAQRTKAEGKHSAAASKPILPRPKGCDMASHGKGAGVAPGLLNSRNGNKSAGFRPRNAPQAPDAEKAIHSQDYLTAKSPGAQLWRFEGGGHG
jgi:hypothetical protein